jgi:hypothetical protein
MRIEHRVGVQASGDRIWEIISYLEAWHGWNPVYPEASGKISYGGVLTLKEALPNLPPRLITGKVLAWTPRELLHLQVSEGFMTHRVQYFEIDNLTETSCIFACGAIFKGFSAKAAAARVGRAFQLGMGVMAEALKARAERD